MRFLGGHPRAAGRAAGIALARGARGACGVLGAVLFCAGAAGVACGSSDDRSGIGLTDGSDEEAATLPQLDADVQDVSVGVDAHDAGADVGAPTLCALLKPAPKFCDDFDDGNLTNNWDVSTVVPPSEMDLDPTTFTSAPFSYVATAEAVPSGAIGNVSLRKTIVASVSHPVFTFDAMFSQTTFTTGVIGLTTLDLSSNHFLRLYLRDPDTTAPAAILEEQVNDTTVRHLLKALPPTNAWVHVVIDADLVAGKVTVSFDAVKALDAEPIVAQLGTEATIRLGAVYVTGPTAPLQFNFDNVILNF